MGNGGGKKKKKEEQQQQNLQEEIQQQQKAQERSEKYEPFSEVEINRLRSRFSDLSGGKNGISIDDFKNYIEIKTHFFRERIYQVVEVEMKKRDKMEIDFDFFVKLLTPFHPLISQEVKYRMLFDIYDIGGDEMISQEDIQNVMKTLYSIQISKDKQEGAASIGEKKKKNVDIEEMKEAFMANPEYLESLAKDIMNDFDKDRSGELDFNEFKDLVDNLDLQFRLNINF